MVCVALWLLRWNVGESMIDERRDVFHHVINVLFSHGLLDRTLIVSKVRVRFSLRLCHLRHLASFAPILLAVSLAFSLFPLFVRELLRSHFASILDRSVFRLARSFLFLSSTIHGQLFELASMALGLLVFKMNDENWCRLRARNHSMNSRLSHSQNRNSCQMSSRSFLFEIS